MTKPRVLYICHNHPANRPGGAEAYAFELYKAVQAAGDFEPIFLAKAGPPVTDGAAFHEGTRLAMVSDDPNEYLFYTEGKEIDFFLGTSKDKQLYTKDFRQFLLAYQPDIVHFQHTLFLGFDMIREVKNTLPGVPIIYTLHELLPICHHSGQMVRTRSMELCHAASPRRCHDCFPGIPVTRFFLREQFIKNHLDLVDLFITPSHFLRSRYLEWGLPEEKVLFEDYGRIPVTPIEDAPTDRPRNRVSFFGQFTRFKGVDVLLEAAEILLEDEELDVDIRLHGANLEYQTKEFQDRINGLLEETQTITKFFGRYEHAQLPGLFAGTDWVVVPSIWWENSPLVIQEAFMYGRPVICSDIGGMAEKVRNGVDGLHFSVRDPNSLADAIRTAVTTPGLWDELRGNVKGVLPMPEHLETMAAIYHDMLSNA